MRRKLHGMLLAGLLIAPFLSIAACDSTVTNDDLKKWTHNELGLERISEVVADPEQPLNTRIRALEVIVEAGFPEQVHEMINQVEDSADRAKIAKVLADQLLKHVENGSKHQLVAKDAVLALVTYLTPEHWALVQKTIADWAFSDIGWDIADADLKSKMAHRMYAGQIMETGKHGWVPAAVLISRGFLLQQMTRFLGEAEAPEATALLLKGLKLRHQTANPAGYQLEALRLTKSAEAVEYLFELYRNPELDIEIRASAFNFAIDLADDPKIKKLQPERVIAQLLKLGQGAEAEDRWQAAESLMKFGAVDKIESVLAFFKDDKAYKEDTRDSAVDFCLDLGFLGHADNANPAFQRALVAGNRIAKGLSLICLKANSGASARGQIQSMTLDATPIGDVFGAALTLGTLAQNTLDGMTYLAALAAEAKANPTKYTAEQLKTKRIIANFELELTGDAFKTAVENRYAGYVAEEKRKAEEAKNPPVEEDPLPPKPPEAPKEGSAPAPTPATP
ncbi:MAG: hypothetical protein ACI9MR_000655 [Myxococcota bacterium]|jgi:hypothetical protein